MTEPARTGDWIPIDVDRYDDVTPAQPGVAFHLFVSPYDLPDAVRGGYDRDRLCFVIELRYIGDEPTREVKLDDHVTLHVGKQSGRLYRIEADVRKLGVNRVALTFMHAIERLREQSAGQRGPGVNYRIAEAVLKDNERQLFRELAVR